MATGLRGATSVVSDVELQQTDSSRCEAVQGRRDFVSCIVTKVLGRVLDETDGILDPVL